MNQIKENKELEELYKETRNYQMAYYIMAAKKLGVEYKVLIPGILTEFSKGDKSWRIHKSLTPINDSVAYVISTYKSICSKFLDQNGIPVPKQKKVKNHKDIKAFVRETGNNRIVVKPSKGFGGKGITILPDENEYEESFEIANKKSLSKSKNRVVVEEYIEGSDYRIMVLGDKVIAAAKRVPATVIGDGKSTVEQLIKKANKIKEDKILPLIPINEETEEALEHINLTLDSVVKKDREIEVRINSNQSTGGTTEECLDKVHPKYKELSVKIAKLLDLKLAGIDLITPDITNFNVKFAINEVNHNPGLRIHYKPTKGEPQDVCLDIQKYILDNI